MSTGCYGAGLDEPLAQIGGKGKIANERQYYFTDALGLTVALADYSGWVSEKYAFSAYGKGGVIGGKTGGVAAFRYAGRRYDSETGLYHNRARAYSSALGRFLQTDPIGTQGGINLYAYAGNDPLNWIDPHGASSENSVYSGWNSGGSVMSDASPDLPIAGQQYAQAAMGLCGAGPGGCAVGVGITALQALGVVATGAAITDVAVRSRSQPEYVVRGGTCGADNFCGGSGVTLDTSGLLQRVSVQSWPNTPVAVLSQRQWIPNNQIGVTTVGAIRAIGGSVVSSPTLNNPYHSTLIGITPQQAQSLFQPTIPNPNPRIR